MSISLRISFAIAIQISFTSAAAEASCSIDGGDSCSLLQQPIQAVELKHSQQHLSCQEMLPLLSHHTGDLLQVCQQGLTAAACESAIEALGPHPWSEQTVARVCEVWKDALGKRREEKAYPRLASLLIRAGVLGRRMSQQSLESSLWFKDDDQVQSSGNSSGNSSNTSAPGGENGTSNSSSSDNSSSSNSSNNTIAPGGENGTSNVIATPPSSNSSSSNSSNNTIASGGGNGTSNVTNTTQPTSAPAAEGSTTPASGGSTSAAGGSTPAAVLLAEEMVPAM